MEKCIGCELCAGICPAKCIYVRGADNDPDSPTSPGERFGFVYEINYLRCIHCDLCVEACPTEAITESKLFEFSFTDRRDAIYTKAELLVDDDGRPQHLPWEDWREGEDADDRAVGPRHRAVRRRRVRRPDRLERRARLRRSAPRSPRRRDDGLARSEDSARSACLAAAGGAVTASARRSHLSVARSGCERRPKRSLATSPIARCVESTESSIANEATSDGSVGVRDRVGDGDRRRRSGSSCTPTRCTPR